MKEAVLEFLRWLSIPIVITIAVVVFLLFAAKKCVDNLLLNYEHNSRHHW